MGDAPSDLDLARACATGDARAIAEVEKRYGSDVDRALGRLRLDTALKEEIKQQVREKLFVGRDGKPPSIASYEGKGPLGAFIRAVVVHAALSAKRAQRGRFDGDSAIQAVPAMDDPELEAIKARYGASFKQAFHDAFAELSARARNALRLVHVEGLAVEQVAVAYGVHRVSVSRWLGDARNQLHLRTRELLRQRLSLGATELASVARLCVSQIDLSLDRLLREP